MNDTGTDKNVGPGVAAFSMGSDRSVPAGHYDLVVVGAGITGVCVAREAASRGHRTLLVDKGDYGCGTSSATTKYLHGGIRYLEQLDIMLVRESLRERRRFALAAPHLVSQTPFVLPVWRWTKPGRFLLGAGAALYDLLAFDRNRDMPADLRISHPRWLSPKATLKHLPWLQPDGLRGAVMITDTLNIHPERLLLALLLDAVSLGAVARNHIEVTAFGLVEQDERTTVRSVQLRDVLSGTEGTVTADRVINAGGPWVGKVLATLGRSHSLSVQVSKGVHLLTRYQGNVGTVAAMARARNGRHVVVSPWQGRYLIGPTDTPVDQGPDEIQVDDGDVQEILDVVNDCRRADQPLGVDDIADTTLGYRPLVADARESDSSKLSRRHVVHHHDEDGVAGLYSIIGGKWTTGRAIAEDAINEIFGHDGSETRTRPAVGSPGWGGEPATLLENLRQDQAAAGVPEATLDHLARLYGSAAGEVLAVAATDPRLAEPVSTRPGGADILAQVVIAVTHEGARTLEDIIQRRLVLGTLGDVTAEELCRVAAVAAPLLNWADDGREEARVELARRQAQRLVWQAPLR